MYTTILAVAALAAGILIGVLISDGPPTEVESAGVDRTPAGGAIDRTSRDSRKEARGASGERTEPMASEAMPAATLAAAPHAVRPEAFPLGARRAWALGLVNRGFAEHRRQEGKGVPEARRRHAADAALDYVKKTLHGFGGWMSSYEEKRRLVGVLGDPPTITIQARGSGTVNAYTLASAHWGPKLSTKPIDVTSPPVRGETFRAFVDSGVQPLDRVFLLERMDVVYSLGFDAADGNRGRHGRGQVDIRIKGRTVLEADDAAVRDRRGALHGLQVLRPPYELPKISVRVQSSVVGLVARGRYVTREEAAPLRDKNFRWAPEGDDGLLGSDAVLLQVVADHGGGNDRKVRLDGSTYRIDSMKEESIWSDAQDLRSLPASVAFFENTGVVPDGRIYRITRIDWRTRLDPQKEPHSDFEIRFRGRKLVERGAEDGTEFSGVWTGELDVKPGEADDFEVVCSYFGMGEAIVYGALVEVPEK